MTHLGDVREALVSRGQDVHLLAHQRYQVDFDEASWLSCRLDPCVSDKRLLYRPVLEDSPVYQPPIPPARSAMNPETLKPLPPLAPTFLQLVWASRIAEWLSGDVKKWDDDGRWRLLRRWLDDRANCSTERD